jgi:hypothetical protein
MAYRSWPVAAGAAVVVLAVIVGGVVGVSMVSGEEPAGGSAGSSGGGIPGDRGTASPTDPHARRPGPGPSGRPMPLPQPVAPRDQGQRPDLRVGASIQSYELVAPDRLQLRYTTGVPECYGRVVRKAVRETPDRVTVTLLLRPPAGAGSQVCPDIAVVEETEVRLDAPLGDRVVVDGGTQRPVRRGHLPQ